MKKLSILLFYSTLLLFSHSYSAFLFSLKKRLSLVHEKFSQLSILKKILGGYLAITVPHGLYKSFKLNYVPKINQNYFRGVWEPSTAAKKAELKDKVIVFFDDIIFFPFFKKPHDWDLTRVIDKNHTIYCNPVFAGICTILNKLCFLEWKEQCSLFTLYNLENQCFNNCRKISGESSSKFTHKFADLLWEDFSAKISIKNVL